MGCIPVTRAKIDCAGRFLKEFDGFTATVEAMDLIRERMPGFELPTCLVKFAAVNCLYFTNVLAAIRMARHIRCVMNSDAADWRTPRLVDLLSELPAEDDEKRAPRFTSFASKFAHFFICPDTFPILDSFVEVSLKHHLGKGYSFKPGERYQRFFERVELLRENNRLTEVSFRSLDGYLWVQGLWLTWNKNKRATINTEIKQLFLDGLYTGDC